MHYDSYDEARHTNEREMIDALAAAPASVRALQRARERRAAGRSYAVDRVGCAARSDAQSAA